MKQRIADRRALHLAKRAMPTGRELTRLLAEVGRAITASLDARQIAQTVVDQAVRVVRADRCAIYFLDDEQTRLEPIVAVDVNDPTSVNELFYAHPIPISAQPLFNHIVASTAPVVVQDTYDDPLTTREFFELFNTRSTLSVPLRAPDGHTRGLLGFFWNGKPHHIVREEIELAAFIGDQTTIALESASLRDDLRRERIRLSTIIESMRDGVLVYDPDGRIAFTNQLTSELLGLAVPILGLLDRQEAVLPLGYTRFPLTFGYDRRAVFERVLRRKEAITGLQVTVGTEPPRLLDAAYAPLIDEKQAVSGVVVSFRDITELRDLERLKATHEATLTLEAVIASTSNGVVVYDDQSRIVLANPAVHEIYGLPEGGIVGLTATEFAGRIASCFASADELSAAVQRIEEQDGSYTEELEIVRPRRRIIRRVVSPVTTRGGTQVGKVAVYHDVTRERAIDRQKDEFLSLASHELKTPLTSVKGYTQVLLGRAQQNGTPEREQRALRTIASQVDRMARLVGELLDISRIDSGQLQVQFKPVDLTELAERVVEQVQLGTSRHEFLIHTPGSTFVYGDADRLEQVVTNLVENAVKYSPEGGAIEIMIEQHAGEVYFAVRDSGIGIPQAQLPHVFTRFYRAQNVSSSISGLGLGLYISHEIIHRHGGSLAVESREGSGSTFRVVLPAAASSLPEER